MPIGLLSDLRDNQNMKLNNKKKVALVLSGGGIKAAAFHIGVCLALQERGFRFAGGSNHPSEDSTTNHEETDDPRLIRTYVGSSAGAVVSSILASGYSVESLVHAFEIGIGKKDTSKPRGDGRLKPLGYKDIFSINSKNFLRFLPKSLFSKSLVSGGLEALIKNGFKLNGLFTAHGIEKYLREHVFLNNNFSALDAELFIVATQLNHSCKVIFSNHGQTTKDPTTEYADYATISEAVAASGSLPPVFAPYGIKNKSGEEIFFFDGEIRETLSAHVAADHGADLIISSYSVQPYHYNDTMGSLHEYGIPIILNQALYQVIEQKIQKHIERQDDIRHIYNAINGYLKQVDLPSEHREKLLEIISERVNYRSNVDYLYIKPDPQDYEMFFVDHFSLNPEILKRIVRTGFRSALTVLRKHDL